MKRPIFLLAFITASLLLLTGCSGVRQLTRLEFDRVETFRIESLGIGTVEGTATVALYNGNKKNVTFDRGRFELQRNGRTVGVMTLRSPVIVVPGDGSVQIPVRIRFSQETLQTATELLGLRRDTQQRDALQPVWRINGEIGIERTDGRQSSVVRFQRRIDKKISNRLGNLLRDATGFNLTIK